MDNPLSGFNKLDVGAELEVPSENTRRTWIEFGISFAAGGIIVSCIPLLLKKVDETIASIVYGFPLTFIPIALLLHFSYKYNSDAIQSFSVKSTFSFLITLAFLGIFCVLLGYRDKENKRKFTFSEALGISVGVWFGIAILLYIWMKYKEYGELNVNSLIPTKNKFTQTVIKYL